MSYQSLVDKVQSYVRLNAKGRANMDIGMLNMTAETDEKREAEEEDKAAAGEEDWWKDACKSCEEPWIGYVGYKGGK